MQLVKTCSGGWLAILLLMLLSSDHNRATAQGGAPQIISMGLETRCDGRIVVWPDREGAQAVLRPRAMSVQRSANAAYNIGLVHSGYSSPDPDGRTVVLTLTLVVGPAAVSQAEIEQLAASGVALGTNPAADVYAKLGSDVEVDVLVKGDNVESSRLQEAMKLPKRVSAGSSLPLQLRWVEVPPDRLRRYLQGDLVFLLKSNDSVVRRHTMRVKYVSENAEQWWNRYVGPTSQECEVVGSDVLLRRLIVDGVITFGVVGDGPLMGTNWATLSDTFRGKLHNAASTRLSFDHVMIERANFISLQWVQEYPYEMSASVPTQQLSVGDVLRSSSALVKDLSGGPDGIEALVGK